MKRIIPLEGNFFYIEGGVKMQLQFRVGGMVEVTWEASDENNIIEEADIRL